MSCQPTRVMTFWSSPAYITSKFILVKFVLIRNRRCPGFAGRQSSFVNSRTERLSSLSLLLLFIGWGQAPSRGLQP